MVSGRNRSGSRSINSEISSKNLNLLVMIYLLVGCLIVFIVYLIINSKTKDITLLEYERDFNELLEQNDYLKLQLEELSEDYAELKEDFDFIHEEMQISEENLSACNEALKDIATEKIDYDKVKGLRKQTEMATYEVRRGYLNILSDREELEKVLSGLLTSFEDKDKGLEDTIKDIYRYRKINKEIIEYLDKKIRILFKKSPEELRDGIKYLSGTKHSVN